MVYTFAALTNFYYCCQNLCCCSSFIGKPLENERLERGKNTRKVISVISCSCIRDVVLNSLALETKILNSFIIFFSFSSLVLW